MKRSFFHGTSPRKLLLAGALFIPSILPAQTKETSYELSKQARKGMLVDAALSPDGVIRLTYKAKVDKKSDEVAYEDYVFTSGLEFSGVEKSKADKEKKPDMQLTSVSAFVGGSNSFNVMSMSLNLRQQTWERKWDYDAQKYYWGKRLSNEQVKPKNNDSKYRGFASYANDDDGSVLVIASYDKGKDDADQFVVLRISNDLNIAETAIPLKGNYSLVFCGKRNNGNMFAVFAPNHDAGDIRKYTIMECTPAGAMVYQNEFTAPSPNTLIMDYTEQHDDLFFVGASTKDNEPYDRVFTSYAPIDNPGYSTSANRQMDKYEKRVMGESFDNFHLLRFSKGSLAFASTTAVKDFKSKLISPPSQKKSHPYDGRKMRIDNVSITPSGDVLVAGQLQDKVITNKGNSYEFRYYDYVCLHFDASGNLKAQYAVEKEFDDKKNESFYSPQHFILSADQKTAYWELMEVKVVKYYESLADAYNGNATYTAHYFPRIAKINLGQPTVSDFAGLGETGKYLVYRNFTSVSSADGKTKYYIGHDEDYEKVWLGKYSFE